MQSNERQQHQGSVLRVLQSKDETRAFYDKISGVYDLLAEHSEGPVRQTGLDKLALAPGERVLEIGYGTGHCLVQLAEAVGPEGKVFGIDLSEGMRARARRASGERTSDRQGRVVLRRRHAPSVSRRQHGRGVHELHA